MNFSTFLLLTFLGLIIIVQPKRLEVLFYGNKKTYERRVSLIIFIFLH
jgi:hypothetical protein